MAANDSHSSADVVQFALGLAERKQSIPLGRELGILRHASIEDCVSVVGPARSGKSSAVFIPAVVCHPGPVIVTSMRTDVRDAVMRSRKQIAQSVGGAVYELVVDSGIEPSPLASQQRWDLAHGCEDWEVAFDRAGSLVFAAMTGSEEGHWRATGQKILSATMLAGRRNGLDAREIRRKLDRRDIADIAAYLSIASEDDDDALEAFDALESTMGAGAAAPDELASIYSTLTSQSLGALRYRLPSSLPELSIDDFLRTWGTIFITVRPERAKNIRALIAASIEAVTAQWRKLSVSQRPPSLLLALDEVANVAPVPSLPQIVTTGGGDGIQALLDG